MTALRRFPSPLPRAGVLDLPGVYVDRQHADEQAMFDREWGAEATLGLAEALRSYVATDYSRRYPVRDVWTHGPQDFGVGPDGPIVVDGVVTIGRPYFDVLVLADTGQNPAFEAVRIARVAPLIATPSHHHRYDDGIGLVVLVVSGEDGRAGHVAQAADRLLVTGHARASVRDIRSRVFCCSIDAIGRPILRYRDDQVVRRMQYGRSRRRHFPDPTYRVYSLPAALPGDRGRNPMVDLGALTVERLQAAAYRPPAVSEGSPRGAEA
jgi:hypothetical protein